MASLNSHIPPIFETSSSLPISYHSTELKLSKRPLLHGFSFPQLFSFAFVFLLLLVQFFLPSPVHIGSIVPKPSHRGAHPESPGVCQKTCLLDEPLPVSRPDKMSLLEEAKKVAAEFDYPTQEVNKGVKEFIRQMSVYNSLEMHHLCSPLYHR